MAVMSWEEVKANFPVDTEMKGVITQVFPFGIFLDLGIGQLGLILVPECGLDRGQIPTDHFRVGETITGVVIWHNDKDQQIRLRRISC